MSMIRWPQNICLETSLWTRVDKIYDKYTQLQGVFIHQHAGSHHLERIRTLFEAATREFTYGNMSHSLREAAWVTRGNGDDSVIDDNRGPGKILCHIPVLSLSRSVAGTITHKEYCLVTYK